MKKIAIIGAGLSGLILAKELEEQGQVTIFEKSRGPGGRLATRYVSDYEFDHGVPFFYAKNNDFISFVEQLQRKDVVRRWDAQFAEYDRNKIISSRKWNDSHSHYVGVPRMNSIAKYLAAELDIKLNTKIDKVSKLDDKWQLFDSEENIYDNFDWLIMAIPVAQAQEISYTYRKNFDELNTLKMSACYALMLGFEKPLELGFEAALVKNADISWIAVSSSKPKRNTGFSLVALSTNKWAEANIDQDKTVVTEHLIKELGLL